MVDYNKRLVEVNEILNYLSYEELAKIPDEIKQIIKENMDKEYKWKYDISKSLKNQGLSRDTIAILSYLNIEYLLNDEQKKLMQEIHQQNERRIEEEKSKIYNKEDLFASDNEQRDDENKTSMEDTSLMEYNQSFISKLKMVFRKIFKHENMN